ncbi:MAG: 50S ribosomal protein L29 [Candidatus Acidiferrales bacterium]
MADRVEKYREMNANELDIQQRELSEQIFRLRFQIASGQAEGLKKMREARKDLARVKTLLRQRQLHGEVRKA